MAKLKTLPRQPFSDDARPIVDELCLGGEHACGAEASTKPTWFGKLLR